MLERAVYLFIWTSGLHMGFLTSSNLYWKSGSLTCDTVIIPCVYKDYTSL